MAFIDVDDTIREVHGYAKQGAAYGYSKVRGLNAQIAVLSTPLVAQVVARARLRRGNVASAKGWGRLLAQAISTARAAGVRGQIFRALTRLTTGGPSWGPHYDTAPGSA